MWWPAIGGIGVGVGGFFFPRGLGVGYDNIAELLRGNAPVSLIVGIDLGQVADVGLVAGVRNIGRRAGAAADDRRRGGCARGHGSRMRRRRRRSGR